MKSFAQLCALATVALAAFAAAVPVAHADTIASKVEQLGHMNGIAVTGLRSARRSGLLFLEAQFSNSGPGDDQFEYRIKWLDRDGFSAGDEEAWKPVLIHGQQKVQIQAIAPVQEAVDFKIEVHSPNNTPYNPNPAPAAAQH
jgi:uncharacterized protein YcfL